VAGARNGQNSRQGQNRQGASSHRTEQEQLELERRRNEQRKKARQEREELEERRNRTFTIAVSVCSAIAVIAIIIFLIVLLNGGVGANVTTVPVPNLIGQVYSELDNSKYPDLVIVFGDFEYSDQYEAGEIMDQSPKSTEQVAVGTKVKVWVSMGPEEDELPTIIDLSGVTEQEARNYLAALDGELYPLVRTENSEDVAEGLVIRTEPAAGEQLTWGQTVVIYISAGREQVLKRVPNVIGSERDNAVKILTQNGFENVVPMPEDSLEPKDQVLRMTDSEGNAIQPNTQVDVTTEITVYYSSGKFEERMPNVIGITFDSAKKVLGDLGFKNVVKEEEYSPTVGEGKVISSNFDVDEKVEVSDTIVLRVSMGPEPTEPPTTVPPETTQPMEVTKSVEIALPTDRTEAYKLTVMLGSGVTVLDDYVVQPGTGSVSVVMTGSGVMTYELYINGVYYTSEKVDFSA
jgi:serine/threonine-protein kinase